MIMADSVVIDWNVISEPMHLCTFSPRKTAPISPTMLANRIAVLMSKDFPLTTGAISSLAPIAQALYKANAIKASVDSKVYP